MVPLLLSTWPVWHLLVMPLALGVTGAGYVAVSTLRSRMRRWQSGWWHWRTVLDDLRCMPYMLQYPFDDPDERGAILLDSPAEPRTGEGQALAERAPVVRAGTVYKLIERLTFPSYVDMDFVSDFLLTFRAFLTPAELLELLIHRYHVPLPEAAANAAARGQQSLSAFESEHRAPIQRRVANVVRKWIKAAWEEDFASNPALVARLRYLCALMRRTGGAELAASLKRGVDTHGCSTHSLLGESGDAIARPSAPPTIHPAAPTPIVPPDEVMRDAVKFCDRAVCTNADQYVRDFAGILLRLDLLELARQLALIDSALFRAIRPERELIDQAWMRADAAQRAPHVLAMTTAFNNWSRWVVACIMREENPRQRTALVSAFMALAIRLADVNDFSAAIAVVAALNSAPVARLSRTMDAVNAKLQAEFRERAVALIDSSGNYQRYRATLRAAEPPLVPYLGIYQTDLIFSSDGSPPRTSGGLINFHRYRLIASVLRKVQLHQAEVYSFVPLPPVQRFLQIAHQPPAAALLDDRAAYDRSLILEPRAAR